MHVDVVVPPLSQTMDTVVLVEWLKQVGDAVVKGEPLFVIETDKANLEVEAPASGILGEVLAEPKSEVAVLSKIAVITTPAGAAASVPAAGVEGSATPKTQPDESPPVIEVADEVTQSQAKAPTIERSIRILASPRARRLAERENVRLDQLSGTGPQQLIAESDVLRYLEHCRTSAPKVTPVARRVAKEAGIDPISITPSQPSRRITRADVEAAMKPRTQRLERESAENELAATPPPDEDLSLDALRGVGPRVPISATRRVIGHRMLESWHNAPQVTLTREVDATELVHLRKRVVAELADEVTQPTLTTFLVAIVAHCLQNHSSLNALTDGEYVEVQESVHMGIAVDTDRGLLVPVLRNVERKGLLELARDQTEVVQRAVSGTASVEEYQGGTFTLTNLGGQGIDAFTPIVNPPQVAILGVGRIHPGVAVQEGQLCIRELMYLSLTFDHRAVDGAPAARFLADVSQMIEKGQLDWLW